MAKERTTKDGVLLGPKNASKWLEWRATRDKRLQNPRRLKTCKDKDDGNEATPSTSSEGQK